MTTGQVNLRFHIGNRALYGPKKKKPTEKTKELADEMADVIFTIICLANSKGIDLDEAFKHMMDKCYGRDKDRYEKKLTS